jgi:hypothetical protein
MECELDLGIEGVAGEGELVPGACLGQELKRLASRAQGTEQFGVVPMIHLGGTADLLEEHIVALHNLEQGLGRLGLAREA